MCVAAHQVSMLIGRKDGAKSRMITHRFIAAMLLERLSKRARVNAPPTSDDEQAKTIIAISVCKWVAKFTSHIVASTMF